MDALRGDEGMTTTTTITYRYDTTDHSNPGWYAEVWTGSGDDARIVEDSMKATFRVNIDDYAEDASDDVRAALVGAYPGATVREGR